MIVREVPLYEVTNFIADVGGLLGLLLGVSAITCYDWTVILVKGIRRRTMAVSNKNNDTAAAAKGVMFHSSRGGYKV